MVEKTRRSVSVLRRCQESDREELNYWRRRSSEQEDPRKGVSGSAPFSKTHSPHSAESGGCCRVLSVTSVRCTKPEMFLSSVVAGAYCCPREEVFFMFFFPCKPVEICYLLQCTQIVRKALIHPDGNCVSLQFNLSKF